MYSYNIHIVDLFQKIFPIFETGEVKYTTVVCKMLHNTWMQLSYQYQFHYKLRYRQILW